MVLVTDRELNAKELRLLANEIQSEIRCMEVLDDIDDLARRMPQLTTYSEDWFGEEEWKRDDFVLNITNPELLYRTANRFIDEGVTWGYVNCNDRMVDIAFFVNSIREALA